ncbi:hypothetical protein LKL90_04840 [Bacillus mobilis]|uniref:hypothetical protein n=1 Tax=Bacillus mobilis TaxID=2026190 RepID=UPI001E5D8BB3|nr:hypothetical protein [Bacillus mobilis]MCC2459693.1 hypothetical protein [Bacillus mobilis]
MPGFHIEKQADVLHVGMEIEVHVIGEPNEPYFYQEIKDNVVTKSEMAFLSATGENRGMHKLKTPGEYQFRLRGYDNNGNSLPFVYSELIKVLP